MKLDELLAVDAARTRGEWRVSRPDEEGHVRVMSDVTLIADPFGSDSTPEYRPPMPTSDGAHDNARAIVAAVNHLAPLARTAIAADAYEKACEASLNARRALAASHAQWRPELAREAVYAETHEERMREALLVAARTLRAKLAT